MNNILKTVIAGPCSAESESQLSNIVKVIKDHTDVDMYRAGVWKPRTLPNSFEGYGEAALDWMQNVSIDTCVAFTTEICTFRQFAAAYGAGIRNFWIGARTSGDPLVIQDMIDDILCNGYDMSELSFIIKNPIAPDADLWIGAIERFRHAEVYDVKACYRGFKLYSNGKYRNFPLWDIALEVKNRAKIDMLCDPSHISGDAKLVKSTAIFAAKLGFDGIMVEVHDDPSIAITDSSQQITMIEFIELIESLKLVEIDDSLINVHRNKINTIDRQIISLLNERFACVDKIKDLKKQMGLQPLQPDQWKKVMNTIYDENEQYNLDKSFLLRIYDVIHEYSLFRQSH